MIGYSLAVRTPCVENSHLDTTLHSSVSIATHRVHRLTAFVVTAELYAYLRSPYRDLSVYDTVVQVRN